MIKILFVVLNLLISAAIYSQWLPLVTGTTQNLNSVAFADGQTGFAGGAGGTIIKTTNGGNSWLQLTTGTSEEIKSISVINSSTAFACGTNGMIIKTTNGGTNWIALVSGTTSPLNGIYFREQAGICTGSGIIIYTTNSGTNWLTGQSGFLVTYHTAFMLDQNRGWVAGVNTIFAPLTGRTTNGGASWSFSTFYIYSNEGTARDIIFTDSLNGIIVSNTWDGMGGISRSSNGGANWLSHQIMPKPLYGVDFPNASTGYAAGADGYVIKSTDNGSTWQTQLSGTAVILRSVDMTDPLTGYISGDGGIVLKTTNGGVTGIEPVSNIHPDEFRLEQNYPNPFNPTTKLRFAVKSEKSNVKNKIQLVIYNSVGKVVEALVNEYAGSKLQAGVYEVEWDATKYASGVYFYSLIADGLTMDTKKMLLIK